MNSSIRERLPYNPEKLKRELRPFYIGANDKDIEEILKTCGKDSLEDFFTHIPQQLMHKNFDMGKHLDYDSLLEHLEEVSKRNKSYNSFIGDSLPQYKIPESTSFVSNIRGLTTAYTPYQPERSQGTLQTLYLYGSLISKLTGFEAINASLYERSTAIFEALNTCLRIKKTKNTVIVCASLFPRDHAVIDTLVKQTKLKVLKAPFDEITGLTDIGQLRLLIQNHKEDLAGVCFPQHNSLGVLEDVHALTDLAKQNELLTVAVIDPFLLATKGLLPPSKFGSDQSGVDMIVGEAQHLALAPNYGGPGLGIFGIRYNAKQKLHIRQTAGRYVGRAFDQDGKEAFCMVLSTREQHIRREKATSNICSNQSFLATLAGAAILWRGEEGMKNALTHSRKNIESFLSKVVDGKQYKLAFSGPFFNEVVLECDSKVDELIEKGLQEGVHIGINIGIRVTKQNRNLLKISFSDKQTEQDIEKLINVLNSKAEANFQMPSIEENLLRSQAVQLPSFSTKVLEEYFLQLGEQNLSPDDNIYPLGSCTMKYNPYINDWAASLSGFTQLHPKSPESASQGALHILYETQKMFREITGLPGVTTQPVAGAQGELVGLKLFQAYHLDKNAGQERDIVFVPRSAHGTNPATAVVAGYNVKNIVTLEANSDGQIDLDQLKEKVEVYRDRVAGIMITNPNTSGIFECQFREIADLIHGVDGLVYMDGANMNAIAGWLDLNAMGVDAVHNNLHKTWTIPHGGGGPGDAIVAVSEKLLDYLPGIQIDKDENGIYSTYKPEKSIGEFHRHYGNFAHKVRAYTYLKALGTEGTRKMAAVSVACSNYIYEKIKDLFPILPANTNQINKMHEFIITLNEDMFNKLIDAGLAKSQVIPQVGKMFLDYGFHAPTVAFPEVYGLMIEPTESFSKRELDRFIAVVKSIHYIINEHPAILSTAPHFTPVRKIDEVRANKELMLSDNIDRLPPIHEPKIPFEDLNNMTVDEIQKMIIDRVPT